MELCPWESAQYFVYSSNIPTLFFYSHFPAVIVALIVGFLVFRQSGRSKTGTTLLIINILFSLWVLFDLFIWATNRPDVVLFFWSLQILIEPLIYLLAFYLMFLFAKNRDLEFKYKLIGLLIYFPIIFFLPTAYNLAGVGVSDCNAIEGVIAQYVTYAVEIIFIVAIFILTNSEYKRAPDPARKKEILTFGLGVVAFLIAFSWGNLIGSFTENWTLAQAGLIGMPIFVVFLAYLIVRFHSFNAKLFGAQALVAGLWLLVFSILFIRRINNVRLVTLSTLVVVSIFGYNLIRSVKREIERKEQLQKLNAELESLIKQRESLMHLITHKVKGSFTHSKYIFAGILDGTFGAVSDDVKKWSEKGLGANDTGIKTVDLVLNAANMQKGLVKYDMKRFDFKNLLQELVAEKKVSAEKKGLQMEKNIGAGEYTVLGDSFWLKEAATNLIENSIRYTSSGKITIGLNKNENRVLLSVKDTGVGITEEDKKNLFTEGGRGKDSIKVNVDSTGYGLYSVKMIVEAHHGRVWAESAGPGTGSTFYIELAAAE